MKGSKVALTKKGEKPSLPVCFVAGASAGAGFWGVFYPLETIKSRIQVCACVLPKVAPPPTAHIPHYTQYNISLPLLLLLLVLYIASILLPMEAGLRKEYFQ